ncbi:MULTISPECIES: DUF6258 family protein [Enterobacterales]|uniref:DUF6258 family protein n=1 Tax=Enterobacterales TaxID=91347 RepID=UPI002ED9C379
MIERLYLGDRAIIALEINSRDLKVRIKIDSISRLSPQEEWGYDDKQNLIGGFLVFSDVYHLEISPAGIIPGDYIIDYDFIECPNGVDFFITTVGQPNPLYKGDDESIVRIKSLDCWLEDANKIIVP